MCQILNDLGLGKTTIANFWTLIVRISAHGLAGWLALILIDFYQRHDKVIHLSFLLKPSSSHRKLQQDERLIHVPLS